MKRRSLIFLLLALLTCSLRPVCSASPDSLSALVVKLRYNSTGLVGYGGSLMIRDIEKGTLFEGQSKGLNPYVIIEDIPNGTYKVEELRIIAGSNVMVIAREDIFDKIVIATPKVYFVGSYFAKKVAPFIGMNFQIDRRENEDVEKIHKQLNKRSENLSQLDIDFGQRLFLEDITSVNIRR